MINNEIRYYFFQELAKQANYTKPRLISPEEYNSIARAVHKYKLFSGENKATRGFLRSVALAETPEQLKRSKRILGSHVKDTATKYSRHSRRSGLQSSKMSRRNPHIREAQRLGDQLMGVDNEKRLEALMKQFNIKF